MRSLTYGPVHWLASNLKDDRERTLASRSPRKNIAFAINLVASALMLVRVLPRAQKPYSTGTT